MKISSKNTLIFCIIVLAVVSVIQLALALNSPDRSEDDLKIASDLAAFSGLGAETVLNIKDAVGEWDIVTENILVYKRIFSLVQKEETSTKEVPELLYLIGKHKPSEVLTVYEFLDRNSIDFKQAEVMLSKHSSGESFEVLFNNAIANQTYINYQPLDKEQIRQLLKQGFLPQDIIYADSIAMSRDTTIMDVMAMKNAETTWEQICQSLGVDYKQFEQKLIALNLEETGGAQTLSAYDYETIVKDANEKAEKNKLKMEAEIAKELGISSDKLNELKGQGFNIWEIKNAYKLSKETGLEVDAILQERINGGNWQNITQEYMGTEGTGLE